MLRGSVGLTLTLHGIFTLAVVGAITVLLAATRLPADAVFVAARDFFLVSAVQDWQLPRWEKAPIALAILLGLVATAGTGVLTMLNAAMLAAGLMIMTRCLSVSAARQSVDWSVLIVIAASFGIGRALETTGAATYVSGTLVSLGGDTPWVVLALVYGVTMLFTAFMSNNAAAALMFPIAIATATSLGVSIMPFVIAVMFAGSNDFATPIGYQTNLMVYGPGGYRFSDYVRFGGPLNLVMWVAAVALIPLIWPF